MTFSMRRVRAIILKDWKDMLKNSYILITILLPLALAAMLARMAPEDPSLLTMSINVALAMTGAFVQASIMAEEKEKNTLRVLLLSPASTLEIMAGKSFLSSVITLAVVIGSVLISGIQIPNLLYFSIMLLLSLVIFISLGTIIGLISRTVMETSVVGLPVLIIFSYGSMLTSLFDNPTVSKLVSYLPTESFSVALAALGQGGSFTDIKWQLLNILLWAAGSLIAAIFVYGKRRFDK